MITKMELLDLLNNMDKEKLNELAALGVSFAEVIEYHLKKNQIKKEEK